MKINEFESLLNVPRANIRYYEKEGLISPERISNGYREYSEENLNTLKKIIILRKLGFSVSDIKSILDGTIKLSDVLEENIQNLQKQMEELKGALEVCELMKGNPDSFDENYYWNLIHHKEKEGFTFFDYAKDYLEHEQNLLIQTFENIFFYPLGEHIKKWRFVIALAVVILVCCIRGIVVQNVWKSGSFLEGAAYPFVIFLFVTIISFPMFVLQRKYSPKDTEPEIKNPTLKQSLFVIPVIIAALFVMLFGIPMLINEIYALILGADTIYVVATRLFIFYIIGAFVSFTYLFWVITGFPIFGIPCTFEKKTKKKIVGVSVLILMISVGILLTWFEAVTLDGILVRHFFSVRNYTWTDVDHYVLSDGLDQTLQYTIVLKDGTSADVLGGSAGFSNLPEELYPNYEEDFALEMTKKFHDQNIELHVDWEELKKKLGDGYWNEYAKKLKNIVNE